MTLASEPPEVPYPSEQEMDREFLRCEEESVPVTNESKGSPWKACPWFYPEYQLMLAEVAEEEG